MTGPSPPPTRRGLGLGCLNPDSRHTLEQAVIHPRRETGGEEYTLILSPGLGFARVLSLRRVFLSQLCE
jgi:hypothetical protein